MATSGIRFALSKCKMLLQDCTGLKSDFICEEEQLNEVVRFNYLGSCILPCARLSDEVSPRYKRLDFYLPLLLT